MNSAIYVGRVRHRRVAPAHAFTHATWMPWLDLSELDEVFRGRWLWSTRRPAPAWFRRADYHGDPSRPLDQAVRDLVLGETGRRPEGPVFLLAHLRLFGWCFNPVAFYHCYDAPGGRLQAIVAEIENTPWGERRAIVLPVASAERSGETLLFRRRKDFHVSPFMPMDIDYAWRFTPAAQSHVAHFESFRDGARVFDATLALRRRPITGRTLAAVLVAQPLATWKVFADIYWQAARLWLKGAPFFEHPGRRAKALPREKPCAP